ncbi:hypothetical protein KUL156_41770 [Alteromonas sp. KUL156]|nr:hypothetical protein KUL154_09390 [Alteromonas sp. KUL154]GFE01585.1 hypothetical protein KUL156_41770 [Alteromonas sp. KUL156]
MNDFKTFLYLKYKFDKGVFNKKDLKEEDFEVLNISRRTFYRHLEWLLKSRLVNEDSHGNIFFRSWKNIECSLGLHFTSKVDFHYSYLLNDNYKGYMMGAIITYYYKLKEFIELRESKKGGLKQIRERFQPLSISYFSGVLNLSKSTVFRLKEEAINSGFIVRKRNLRKTGIKAKEFNINKLRESWSDYNTGYPKLIKGELVIVESDLLRGRLRLKRYR